MNDRISWLNPKLEARENGNRDFGVFARINILKDERLAVFGGYVMLVGGEPAGDYALQIADDLVIGMPSPTTSDPAEFFNHSCDPNAGLHGQIFLVAMRDIKAEEQVCFDYAMVIHLATYRFPCRCGSSCCRGVVTGEDWKLQELQQRYAGYFSWYLQEKINRLRMGAR